MSKNETPYIATVNGINIGSFRTLSEADVAGGQAVSRNIAGPWVQGKPRIVEVRDANNGYMVVLSRQY